MSKKQKNTIEQMSFDGVLDLGATDNVSSKDFQDKPLVVFASFGNDSIALIQWVFEEGFQDVTVIYNNTGWASKAWPERVLAGFSLCADYGFDYAELPSIGMKDLVRWKKGWPPNGPMQFCTNELKIVPSQIWLIENDPEKEMVCLTGVRREESANRKDIPVYLRHSPDHGNRPRWAPLALFGESERDELILRAGFEVLPHSSDECKPCIPNANKDDILRLSEEEIQRIEDLEKEMGFTKFGKPRTAVRPARAGGAVGIRNVVRWANGEPFEIDPDYIPGEEEQIDDCETGWCGR